MSVAPEIAILAEAALLLPAQPATRAPEVPQVTLGTLARQLRMLAATPERWWGLVRFNPDRSVEIGVEDHLVLSGLAGGPAARRLRPGL